MSDNNIRDKIRKLLALARDKGATENEASNAMTMATALMAKYRIDQSELEVKSSITGSCMFGDWYLWAARVVGAAAELCAVRWSIHASGPDSFNAINFYGPELDMHMAADMFNYLLNEVEKAYKRDLPKGMTKAERSEFRKTYKFACANRLWTRAGDIVQEMKRNDQAAKATGSRALVVAASFDQQLSEIEEWMKQQGMKLTHKAQKAKVGSGTFAGHVAGDTININAKVGG